MFQPETRSGSQIALYEIDPLHRSRHLDWRIEEVNARLKPDHRLAAVRGRLHATRVIAHPVALGTQVVHAGRLRRVILPRDLRGLFDRRIQAAPLLFREQDPHASICVFENICVSENRAALMLQGTAASLRHDVPNEQRPIPQGSQNDDS